MSYLYRDLNPGQSIPSSSQYTDYLVRTLFLERITILNLPKLGTLKKGYVTTIHFLPSFCDIAEKKELCPFPPFCRRLKEPCCNSHITGGLVLVNDSKTSQFAV